MATPDFSDMGTFPTAGGIDPNTAGTLMADPTASTVAQQNPLQMPQGSPMPQLGTPAVPVMPGSTITQQSQQPPQPPQQPMRTNWDLPNLQQGYGGPGGMPTEQALDLIAQPESGNQNVMNWRYNQGQPDASGLRHTAGGYWQITDTNWKKYAPQLGINTQQYPTAISAPRDVQKQVAAAMYEREGFAPWAPYNPALRQLLGGYGGGGGPMQASLQSGDPAQMMEAVFRDVQAKFNTYSDETKKAVTHMLGVYNDAIKNQRDQGEKADQAAQALEVIRMGEAQQKQDMDKQLTDWANKTPTREATYALGMQMAAPLSILAAIGGAMTKTNALGLLAATNGIMEGINSGSEEKYHDAINQWKDHYEMMKDHQERSDQVFKTMEAAYAGRLDAADKALARTRQLMQDTLAPDQLKISSDKDLWNGQAKVWDSFDKIPAALARIQEVAMFGRGGLGLGTLTNTGQPFDPTTTKLKDLTPMELKSLLGTNALTLPAVGRAPLAAEAGAISLYPDQLAMDYVRTVRANQLGMKGSTREVVAAAARTLPVTQSVAWLNRQGGGFDRIRAAAEKVDFSDNKVAIAARRWYSDHVQASPEIQRLITAIDEARPHMSVAMSIGGRTSDMARGWADEASPIWTSKQALLTSLDESSVIAKGVQDTDVDVMEGAINGESLSQVYGRITARSGGGAGGAAGGAGAAGTTQPVPARGIPRNQLNTTTPYSINGSTYHWDGSRFQPGPPPGT